MKKLFCLLLAALLLWGCQPAPQLPTDDTTEPTVQTQPPTQTTPPETTEPTQETMSAEELQYFEDWEAYCSQPFTLMIIPGYEPGNTYEYAGKDFDESGMIAGNYYTVDDGEVYYLIDQRLLQTKVTAEHIYYVPSSDPAAVYRCTLHGEDHTLIYRSDFGTINQVHYNGTDSDGQLLLSEFGESQRIIGLDISTGEVHVLLEPDRKVGFFYRPHSLDQTEQNKGPMLEIAYLDEYNHYVYKYYLLESGTYLP